MAIRFAAVFAVLAVGALTSVYFITLAEMETQIDRELTHEIRELVEYNNQEPLHELIELIQDRDQYGKHLHHFYALTDSNRQRITGNKLLIESSSKAAINQTGITFFRSTLPINDNDISDTLRGAITALPDNNFLIVGQMSHSISELKEHTYSAVVIAVITTIILALLTGAYMGRIVLERINRINNGLITVIESNFKTKLKVPEENDEFQALTLKLNVMLQKIESLFEGMRQVTDNVAHDLRSPLNRLRSRLEVTLLQSRDEEEYREAMQQAINDCDSLLRTFNALLSIAQAEAGAIRKDMQPVNITEVVSGLTELYQAVAEEKGQSLNWLKAESITIKGNKELLTQAISNLIENAIKYTPDNGEIYVSVFSENKQPTIQVCDNGPGIPEADRKRVLHRFQRLDDARSSPGNGLGLSLVNAVAKLHHATLTLSDNQPGLKAEISFQVNSQ